MKYDFKILSYIEFEELTRDILSRFLSISFRTYGVGRDLGIDLSAENRKNIVQVKHYANSTFSNLKTTMKKEFKKMEEIVPDKYILVTSLSLTPANITTLVESSSGLIKKEDDIFDLNRLNDILTSKDFEDIEKKYYKLWISGVAVMERILNNGVINQIEEKTYEIRDNLPKVVVTNTFQEAYKQLKKEKAILIHGEPGIGKTTLADLLVYKFMEKDFRLKFMSGNDLDKLMDIVNTYSQEKEVIFLDDFLGSNILSDLSTVESKLERFINSILRQNNKYLIMTTRSTILKKSMRDYEKINNTMKKLSSVLLEMKNYTPYEKAKIFYNHIYFNNLRDIYKEKLKINKNYIRIVTHRNYNPRIIEFITDESKIRQEIEGEDYISFIDKKLNNPKDIWEYEFKKLRDVEKIILFTLLSFNSEIKYSYLEEAFETRYIYEIETNHFIRETNCFKDAMEILCKSFIKLTHSLGNLDVIVDFINPSVRDYLIDYIKYNKIESERIINNVLYLEQFNIFTRKNKSSLGKDDIKTDVVYLIKDKIIKDYKNLKRHSNFITSEKYVFDIIENFNDEISKSFNLEIIGSVYDKAKSHSEYREILNKILNDKSKDYLKKFLEEKKLYTNIDYLDIQNNKDEFLEVIKYINTKLENDDELELFKENYFYNILDKLEEVFENASSEYLEKEFLSSINEEDYIKKEFNEETEDNEIKIDGEKLKDSLKNSITDILEDLSWDVSRYLDLDSHEEEELKQLLEKLIDPIIADKISDLETAIIDNYNWNYFDDYEKDKDDDLPEPSITLDEMFEKM